MSSAGDKAAQRLHDAMMSRQIFGMESAQGLSGGAPNSTVDADIYNSSMSASGIFNSNISASDIYNKGIGVGVGPGVPSGAMTGRLTNSSANFSTVRKPRIEDAVLFRGEPIPEEWRGAKINAFTRVWDDKLWGVVFKSEWTAETLILYLSTDKYSGEQADAIAVTHMEALNQRRVG